MFLIVEVDRVHPSVICYASVSWYGKTNLRFIEGYADGQDNIPIRRKKRKTINQIVYRNEMCPNMFRDIGQVMNGKQWMWHQHGAKPHTAADTVVWLKQHTPNFIEPNDWPSKSPDLNVMNILVEHSSG